jgi:hypothetical protein
MEILIKQNKINSNKFQTKEKIIYLFNSKQ